MTASKKPPPIRITLIGIQSMAELLLQEEWEEYDRTLVEALNLLARQSLKTLQNMQRSIKKITPEESTAVSGQSWASSTLEALDDG